MNKSFWILIGVIFFTEYCVGPFIDNLNDTLVKRFQIPYVTAGEILIIPYGLASILSIALGKMLSIRPTWRRKSFFLASLLYFLGLAGLYFLPNIRKGDKASSFHYVVIAFFCIAMSFIFAEIYSCLCSCIIYVVEKKYLGTAWGVIGSTLGFS
jgi:hypothetical protein